MSGYLPIALYDLEGNFQGFAIRSASANKLQSTNIYAEGEEDQLNEQLARLNEQIDLRTFWPNPKDPEVLALLDDEQFVPLEYIDAEVVDDEHSHYVWQQEPEVDEFGHATGRMVQGAELDEGASVIAYKTAKVPKRPSDIMWRIKKACEVIARKRAGLLE